jgi:hypothetical protein
MNEAPCRFLAGVVSFAEVASIAGLPSRSTPQYNRNIAEPPGGRMSQTSFAGSMSRVMMMRGLCGAIAAIVVVDAVSVGAPGLALLGVPFLIGAVWLRQARTMPSIGLAVWSLLYVVLGVSYAAGAGFDAGWGDLLFAYGGTPAAVLLMALIVQHLRSHAPLKTA